MPRQKKRRRSEMLQVRLAIGSKKIISEESKKNGFRVVADFIRDALNKAAGDRLRPLGDVLPGRQKTE
jgi:hypothetical protein